MEKEAQSNNLWSDAYNMVKISENSENQSCGFWDNCPKGFLKLEMRSVERGICPIAKSTIKSYD